MRTRQTDRNRFPALVVATCAAMAVAAMNIVEDACGQSCPPEPLNANAGADSGDDTECRLATDGLGTWVAVWRSADDLDGTIGTDEDVLFARSTDNGATWSGPAALNSNAAFDAGSDEAPHVATDGAGVWITTWHSTSDVAGAGSDFDILFARSADDGLTWSAPLPLNSNAAFDIGIDTFPHTANDGGGRWLATWQSTNSLETLGTDTDILVATSTDDGITWTDPAPLNSNAAADTGHDSGVSVATDGAGTWIAVWRSNDTLGGTLGGDYDILSAVSVDDARTWSAPAPVNSEAPFETTMEWPPRIVTDGAGVWLVTWWRGVVFSSTEAFSATSFDDGATWSDQVAINAGGGDQFDQYPSPATDGLGNWLVAWESDDSTGGAGSDRDILFATSADGGLTWSTPGFVNTTAITDTASPFGSADARPALVAGGGVIVTAWESAHDLGGAIGTDDDIHVTTIDLAAVDCNGNDIIDLCELPDCNGNRNPDDCDITEGFSLDCNANGVPDECEAGHDQDCNGNGLPDLCDIFEGIASDCNGNAVPDSCDIEIAFSSDCDGDGTPDECQISSLSSAPGGPFFCTSGCDADCNNNGVPDACDLLDNDCNGNGVPDECDAAGIPTEFGPTLLLNGNATSDDAPDNSVSLAADGNGTWAAIWASTDTLNDTIGDDRDILVARSLDAGVTWTFPEPLNSDAANDSAFDLQPHIVTDGSVWVAVWYRAGSFGDIWYARSIDGAETWTAAQPLAVAPNSDENPRIATDGAGRWVVVWRHLETIEGSPEEDFDTWYTRSTNGALTWTAPQPLRDTEPADGVAERWPDVAIGSHAWIATWYVGAFGDESEVLYSRSLDGGVSWSDPLPVDGTPGPDGFDDFGSRVVSDGDSWLLGWSREPLEGDPDDTDVVVVRSFDDGLTWSAPVQVNTSADVDTGDDGLTDLQTDRAGNWLAIWSSNENFAGEVGVDGDVVLARSTDAGATWTPPAVVNSTAGSDSQSDDGPVLATDGAGSWVAAWFGQEPIGGSGTDPDIFATTFALPGADCNGNGEPDDCDIDGGGSFDLNGNGLPDECECIGDTNGDGTTDVEDLVQLLLAWGECDGCPEDLDLDGTVGVADLVILVLSWGDCD